MMEYGKLDHNAREKQNIGIAYDFLKLVHSDPQRAKKLVKREKNFKQRQTLIH